MTFYLKQGDTSPAILKQMLAADGTPVNLTGAIVRFSMASKAGVNVIDRAAAAVFTGTLPGGGVVAASDGWMRYVWTAPNTAAPGEFNAEFEVTFADGSIETAPNSGYETIHITRQL